MKEAVLFLTFNHDRIRILKESFVAALVVASMFDLPFVATAATL